MHSLPAEIILAVNDHLTSSARLSLCQSFHMARELLSPPVFSSLSVSLSGSRPRSRIITQAGRLQVDGDKGMRRLMRDAAEMTPQLGHVKTLKIFGSTLVDYDWPVLMTSLHHGFHVYIVSEDITPLHGLFLTTLGADRCHFEVSNLGGDDDMAHYQCVESAHLSSSDLANKLLPRLNRLELSLDTDRLVDMPESVTELTIRCGVEVGNPACSTWPRVEKLVVLDGANLSALQNTLLPGLTTLVVHGQRLRIDSEMLCKVANRAESLTTMELFLAGEINPALLPVPKSVTHLRFQDEDMNHEEQGLVSYYSQFPNLQRLTIQPSNDLTEVLIHLFERWSDDSALDVCIATDKLHNESIPLHTLQQMNEWLIGTGPERLVDREVFLARTSPRAK